MPGRRKRSSVYELTIDKNVFGDHEYEVVQFNQLSEVVAHYKAGRYSALDCELWDNINNQKLDMYWVVNNLTSDEQESQYQ